MKDITQLVFKPKKSAVAKGVARPGTIWFDNDDPDEIDALSTLAIKEAGFKRSDFFKPVRVDHLVVDDMPPEGVFDSAFCDRYKLAEDGKSWLLPAAKPVVADSARKKRQSDESITDITDSCNTTSAETTTATADSDSTADAITAGSASTPAYEYNVNGEPMTEVMKNMDWPVVEMSLPMRWMAQIGKDKKVTHLSPEEYGRVMAMTAPQDDDEEPLLNNINLMLVGDMAAEIDKLDAHKLFRLVKAVEKVAKKDGRMGLHLLCRFVRAWLDTEYIDQGVLVKSWCEGKRISRIEKAMQVITAGDASELQNTKNGEAGVSVRPRRSEKPTHRTINYELGCGFYDDLDFDNLRPAMDFAKRIIAEDREDWKRMSITAGIIPDIKEFDRQTIIDLVRKAPAAVHSGSPELRRTWCESYLAVHGVRDPDWYEYAPNKATTTHKENLDTVRKAGKCLRDIEAGRFQCEEETQSTGILADEPAAAETVAPDSTEYHQDPQSMETESPVADDGDQVLREQVSEQLAAGRGDYVPGISDPDDLMWVRNDYSASNEGEKTEVTTDNTADTTDAVDHSEEFSSQSEPETNHSGPVADHSEPEAPETKPKSQKPEPATKVADGVFDASAFFADTSNQGEKTEVTPLNNDDRTTKQAVDSRADNEPDRSLTPEPELGPTLEMLMLLRKMSRNLQHIVDINQQILDSNQRILGSNLRIEKKHSKDAAAIRGMLAMIYATETEGEITHGE